MGAPMFGVFVMDSLAQHPEVKFGWQSVAAVDGVHVLWTSGHHHDGIAKRAHLDGVFGFTNRGFKRGFAIGRNRDIHPQVERVRNLGRLKANGDHCHSEVVGAVVVIIRAAENFVSVDITT